ENALDDIGYVLRHAYRTDASAERSLGLWYSIRLELYTESRLHRLHRAGELHRALRDTSLHDVEPVLIRELFDLFDIGGISTVSTAELLACSGDPCNPRCFRTWLTPQTDGNSETLVRAHLTCW